MIDVVSPSRPSPDALFDTPWLLARVASLREEWRLSHNEVSALLDGPEADLVDGLRAGRKVLDANVEARIRHLDEVNRYAGGLLAGHEASAWLRAPAAALLGRTPLDVMSREQGAIRAVRDRLREEHVQAFGVGA